jgi:hypothetical protein
MFLKFELDDLLYSYCKFDIEIKLTTFEHQIKPVYVIYEMQREENDDCFFICNFPINMYKFYII